MVIVVGIIIYGATKLAVKRQQRMFGGSIQLSDIYDNERDDSSSQDEEIENEEALLTFDNVTYTVGKSTLIKDMV